MKTIKYPRQKEWESLCRRPEKPREDLENIVGKIIEDVRIGGDEAILQYCRLFDSLELNSLTVSSKEIDQAISIIPEDLKQAINMAKSNIEKFHENQLHEELPIETVEGVSCWRKSLPIERVGLYIPGGTAPLFSTVLMLAIPAKIAGCKEVILCSPPAKNGKINPAILYAAKVSGISRIFKVGGAQAIAAMSVGTQSIPKAYKLFGPGNQFVTKAKEMVRMYGTEIDMPAGPSEVLVIADSSATPSFIAADLLSQAEHGVDSQVVFVTNDPKQMNDVEEALERQLIDLPRKEIAHEALENSMMILFKTLDECISFSNNYAPEHLIINTIDARTMAEKVVNAGSVFIGNYSCESAGDYASGTNHTLPTNGHARVSGGVSVDSFMRKITFQEISEVGIENIGPSIEKMAEHEGLCGHKNAVTIRLNSLKNV